MSFSVTRRTLRSLFAAALLAAAQPLAPRRARPSMQPVSSLARGARSSQPLVSQWQAAYPPLSGVNIVYQPIGSGGGIQAITNRTVDFGASDAPLDA